MPNCIIDENYLDIIVENELLDLYSGHPVTYINNKVSEVHIMIDKYDPCLLGRYHYHSLPTCYTVEANVDFDTTGVSQVQNNPYFALYGNQVLVGIVDTGIEYTHEAFLDSTGKSRIATIWDQTVIDESRQPERFGYGAVYEKDDIDRALQAENPYDVVPVRDYHGHGTTIAGIIAGSVNAEKNFTGVVPKAQLMVVKCKPAKKYNKQIYMIPDEVLCYEESDVMLGIRFLTEEAARRNRPLVICICMGSEQGGHDGNSAIASYISYTSQLPRISIVVSSGNEGNSRRHFFGKCANNQVYTDFELNINHKDAEFTMEIWQMNSSRVALEIHTPTGEQIRPVYPRINECREFDFIFESSRVWINNKILETETGDQMIVVRLQNAQEGVWKFRIHNMDGEELTFHAWLPGDGILSEDTFFLNADPDTTISSPGNASMALTVAAYDSIKNAIWSNSSRGYSRNGSVKPDLAAPGVDLLCPVTDGHVMAIEKIGRAYGSATGSGAAAAFAAGIVAMILEWAIVRGNYDSMNGNDIKKLLIRGAKRDVGMGALQYPNNIWGYGKINIYELFDKIR